MLLAFEFHLKQTQIETQVGLSRRSLNVHVPFGLHAASGASFQFPSFTGTCAPTNALIPPMTRLCGGFFHYSDFLGVLFTGEIVP